VMAVKKVGKKTDKKKGKMIRIRLKKSVIGKKPRQRKTALALGLRKIDTVVEKEATPQIMGMVRKISHLVEIEELR
jgi:large subunit ribosomal protein L30